MGGHLVSGSYDTTVRIWGVQPETEFECVGVFGAHNDAVRVLTSAGRNATTVFSVLTTVPSALASTDRRSARLATESVGRTRLGLRCV